jgi:hypothetical protein
MKHPSPESLVCARYCSPAGWTRWRAALALFFLGAGPLLAQSINDDFNDQTDNGAQGTWTHYDLGYWTDYLSGGLGSYGTAHYSFPANPAGPAGNYGYRLQGEPVGTDPFGIGPARVGSYRADAQYGGAPYSVRFQVGADLVAWSPATLDQDVGLLFMVNPATLAPGAVAGYALTYQASANTLYLSSIASEQPSTIGAQPVALDPTHQYRFVVATHDGTTFLGTLFDMAQPNNPVASAITTDTMYQGTPGICGLVAIQENDPPSDQPVDATFDNYSSSAPAAGAMPATVTDLTPPPAGKSTAVYPTVSVGILNRDTSVDTGSILLWMDSVLLPAGSLAIDPQVHKPNNPFANGQAFPGATVSYAINTLYPPASQHTNALAFKDDSNTWHTNAWTWTMAYPFLYASNSLPLGCLNVRGFEARMAQSDNGGVQLENSLNRALQQLAIPPLIPIDRAATSIVQVLNWDKAQDPPNNVPGLCAGTYQNIAVESVAYLELSAGVHRFHINTDDRAGLYSGVNLTDRRGAVLWENPANTADSYFDFVVEAPGLYPVCCLWEETGGGAHLNLYSVNLSDASEVLLNDPADPAGVVKAWFPLACKSAASVAGPYTVDAGAVNALTTADIVGSECAPAVVGQMVTGGAFTVPVSGTAGYYRLDGPRTTRITGMTTSGANLLLNYQVQ